MDSMARSDVQAMNEGEITALFSCKEELANGIDPILVASKLQCIGLLSTIIYSKITCMFSNGHRRRAISEFLISHLPLVAPFQTILNILFECGYVKLAHRLFIAYLRQNTPSHVYKTTSGQRSGVHSFFRRLKTMVHDAQFDNPRLALRNLANRFVEKLSEESNPSKRQLLADKCVAIIGAEIDAIAITFDNNLHQHDVFAEIKKLMPETSNTLITDVIYYGRLANANSIAGKFDDSENMLAAARSRAYHTGPCLELVNMLYIEVYVKLWEFEKNPSEEIRKSLLMWGRLGLESLEEETEETRSLWRRMFILRMVFCLLGLGNKANLIEGCIVDEACKREASQLLASIDKHWQGIETRREMFYHVARARLCEWNGDLTNCITYLKRAKSLAAEGHFEEIKYIAEYHDFICSQQTLVMGDSQDSHGVCRNFVLTKSQSSSSGSCVYAPRTELAVSDIDTHRHTPVSTQLRLDVDPTSKRRKERRFDVGPTSTRDYVLSGTCPTPLYQMSPENVGDDLHDQTENSHPQLNMPLPGFLNDSIEEPEMLQQKSYPSIDSLTRTKEVARAIDTHSNCDSPFVGLKDDTFVIPSTNFTHLKQVGDNAHYTCIGGNPEQIAALNFSEEALNHTDTQFNTMSVKEQDISDRQCTHDTCRESLQQQAYANIDQLNSIVLFEEREEPSGCSRDSGRLVPPPPSGNCDLPWQPLHIYSLDTDNDSVDSLKLLRFRVR